DFVGGAIVATLRMGRYSTPLPLGEDVERSETGEGKWAEVDESGFSAKAPHPACRPPSPQGRRVARGSLPANVTHIPANEAVRKLLLIQFDHLGDGLLSTALFAPLRAAFPHATIDVLAAPWNRQVFEAADQ